MNKSLNSYRAFAFLGVFIFHSTKFHFGYLGVHAFFVLSGYLITPILLKTKANTASFKDFLVNFYGRRALRIFPPYYFYLLLVLLIIVLGGLQNNLYFSEFIGQLPWALTYTYDFYHASTFYRHTPLVTHFWSLAVEEQFYIFWPFLIYFTSKENLKKVFIFLMVSGPVIRLVTGFIVDHHFFSGVGTIKDIVIYVSPFSHIDAFVIGGFFSVYWRKFVPRSIVIYISLAGILLLGLITCRVSSGSFYFESLGYPPFMTDSLKYIWGYTLFSFFFGMLLLRLNHRDFVPAIFENRIISYLGKISYGLYIYHYAIFELVIVKFKFGGIYNLLAALLLTIVISVLSFELFEKFTLAWKDKFFPKKAAVN